MRTSRQPSYQQVVALQKAIASKLQRTIAIQLIVVPTTKLDPLVPPTNTPTATPAQVSRQPHPDRTPIPTHTMTPLLPTTTLTPTPTAHLHTNADLHIHAGVSLYCQHRRIGSLSARCPCRQHLYHPPRRRPGANSLPAGNNQWDSSGLRSLMVARLGGIPGINFEKPLSYSIIKIQRRCNQNNTTHHAPHPRCRPAITL